MDSVIQNFRKLKVISYLSLYNGASYVRLLFRFSVSTLSRISSTCPNIELWYNLAKNNTDYGDGLYNSTSSISELGSIMGKTREHLIKP